MRAIVSEIKHPNEHMNPRLYVTIRGKVEQVDAYKNDQLYDELAVGDQVDVHRLTNSPYVYIEGTCPYRRHRPLRAISTRL